MLAQVGPLAWRATEVLRRQPDFWQRLAGCLPDAAQRSLTLSPAAAPQDEDENDSGEAEVKQWLRKQDTAWRLAAEAGALQLLALEAFASPPGSGGFCSTSPELPWSSVHRKRFRWPPVIIVY